MKKENEDLKIRDAFSRKQMKMGMPSGVFMGGIVAAFASYFLFKLFFAPFIVAGMYFPLMFRIHKDDERGLSIWWACAMDKKNSWMAGSVQDVKINLIPLGSND